MSQVHTRRSFVQVAAAALAAAALPSALAAEPDRRNALLAVKLSNLVEDRAPAAAFGKQYLVTAPDESDPAKLAGLISDGRPSSLLHATEEERQELLQRLIEADYRTGNLVDVFGWMLPRTEARLYALWSLSR